MAVLMAFTWGVLDRLLETPQFKSETAAAR
jgi:hypothetical protein